MVGAMEGRGGEGRGAEGVGSDRDRGVRLGGGVGMCKEKGWMVGRSGVPPPSLHVLLPQSLANPPPQLTVWRGRRGMEGGRKGTDGKGMWLAFCCVAWTSETICLSAQLSAMYIILFTMLEWLSVASLHNLATKQMESQVKSQITVYYTLNH